MCLITFSWNQHPKYKLILVANRDEYFKRPSQSLHQWDSGIYAGKDLKEGGTWLGFHPSGRFAALTNFRDMDREVPRERSRGELVTGFLESKDDPLSYLQGIDPYKNEYNGFNLLVADKNRLYILSNYGQGIQEVSAGIHAISNAFLDSPWPKVNLARQQFEQLLKKKNPEMEDLHQLLQSTEHAPEDQLPATGLSKGLEKAVSAQFIRVDDYYGTVNTTALLWDKEGEVHLREVRTIPEPQISECAFRVN
ncbi:NRDE family protein [Cyclobacterium jeungdonense]|uniref:NRDE family protein n=1 Tax=Cyclobacterium jeungdonense TaxID=708087 RepID=A0ABT8CDE6_9BACT|nr:NRDE family protein [Cyclobacterium jeungdonense]MDN3689578.1 NRDE family protein [Cyclobacterium jeungdonense]